MAAAGDKKLRVEVPNNVSAVEDRAEGETRCGLGPCRPRWIQPLADPKAFAFFFCILGFLQGAYFTYFIGVLSTLEKRYSYESKISGIILIADNLSPIFTSTCLGFFSRRANRAHLVGWGMIFVVLANYFAAVPYFIYGSAPSQLVSRARKAGEMQFCLGNDNPSAHSDPLLAATPQGECVGGKSTQTIIAILFFFIGSFFKGFGSTAYYTVGMPFIDDNIKKKNSPAYYALVTSVRLFGPAFGFLLSSFSLRHYEDINNPPDFSLKDPRWVGAWWLGFVILGTLTFVFSLPLFFFPSSLGSQNYKAQDATNTPKLKNMPEGCMRLLKNPVMMLHLMAAVFNLNGILGYFLVNPRYMEAQFKQSASDASLYSGPISIVGMQVGILAGGLVIRIFRPKPRWITLYDAFTDFMNVVTVLVCMFLACPSPEFSGTMQGNSLNLISECNKECGCTNQVFTPLCDESQMMNYFSPCHSGCGNSSVNGIFNCSCISRGQSFYEGNLREGLCQEGCQLIISYIVMLTVGKFIVSSSKVGSILVSLRCVDPVDKAFSMGAFEMVLSILTFIPYPLMYGAVTDASCLVWEEKCGTHGNCWVYDVDKLRYYIHGMTLIFLFLGTLCHVGVFLLSHRLRDFYKDEDVDQLPEKDGAVAVELIQNNLNKK